MNGEEELNKCLSQYYSKVDGANKVLLDDKEFGNRDKIINYQDLINSAQAVVESAPKMGKGSLKTLQIRDATPSGSVSVNPLERTPSPVFISPGTSPAQ
ncbi:MAG: hypothetical protein ACJATL_000955 [Rickettsiales bacterium]|jgi:hypothetical protein